MSNEDCIFCKIVAGEIPCTKVYEDEKCLAFEDLNPCAPVHTLIVPKEHYANVADNVPTELLGHLLQVVKEVAKIKGIDENGYRVSINTGEDGGQTVHHLHLHVNGGAKLYCGRLDI